MTLLTFRADSRVLRNRSLSAESTFFMNSLGEEMRASDNRENLSCVLLATSLIIGTNGSLDEVD